MSGGEDVSWHSKWRDVIYRRCGLHTIDNWQTNGNKILHTKITRIKLSVFHLKIFWCNALSVSLMSLCNTVYLTITFSSTYASVICTVSQLTGRDYSCHCIRADAGPPWTKWLLYLSVLDRKAARTFH